MRHRTKPKPTPAPPRPIQRTRRWKSCRAGGTIDGSEEGTSQGESAPVVDEKPAFRRLIARYPLGGWLATGGDAATVKVWDVSDAGDIGAAGRELLSLGPGNDGRDVAYSADGRLLATTSGSGLVRVYVISVADLVSLA